MYHTQPPIFGVLDHPSLRHVKPLPKRRRRADNGTERRNGAGVVALAGSISPIEVHPAVGGPLSFEADTKPGTRNLPQFYLPFKGTEGPFDMRGPGITPMPAEREDDGGDYSHHLQQPGNTKKRKVPANMAVNRSGEDGAHDSGDAGTGGHESLRGDGRLGRGIPMSAHGVQAASAADEDEELASDEGMVLSPAQMKRLSPAARAGLAQKEAIRTRRRQLAPLLGSLASTNMFALDQALATTYPEAIVRNAGAGRQIRMRLSRRRGPRHACESRLVRRALPAVEHRSPFPTDGFLFECLTASSDRHAHTRGEVARLQEHFEEELSRQAARAAEAAKQAAAVATKPKGKRSERSRPRAGQAVVSNRAFEQATSALLEPPLATGKKKKKKRSTLANASNPHHLRNYVPSRLPQTGHTTSVQVSTNAHSVLGSLALLFLSAELPPRNYDDDEALSSSARLRQARTATTPTYVTDPADEWICPFCEYSLFYSDDLALERAVRARKKILKRRRRAVERAAAAASGKAVAAATSTRPAEENQEALFEAPYDDVPASTMAQTRWKSERREGNDRRPEVVRIGSG